MIQQLINQAPPPWKIEKKETRLKHRELQKSAQRWQLPLLIQAIHLHKDPKMKI